MNTFYKSYFIALGLLVSIFTHAYAQTCNNATITLDANGTATLDVGQVLNFHLGPDQSAFVLPAYFTCENVYEPTAVTVYLIDNGDTTNVCTQDVTVVDSNPPLARCKSNIHVQLGENGEYRFVFDDVNDHSYDLCTEVTTKKFFPDRIRCTDPNPINVMMVVRDFSGNVDTCTVEVSYDDYTGPTDPIQCRDSLKYYFYVWDDSLTYITPDKVLVRGVHGCVDNYSIDLYDGAVLKPVDYVSVEDTMHLLTALLTELGSGEQCTTAISVIAAHDPCEFPTLMCDSKCNSTPFGDCASGHTEDDIVELPCDVFITDWCASSGFYPDPEFIEWYGHTSAENAWPTSAAGYITPAEPFGNTFVGYWDQVIALPTGQQIVRDWTILNWCTQQTIDHIQNIFVSYDLTDICDTLAWDAPAGDCQSGHTLTDDVEWPADITIHSLFSHPDDLALNPEVRFENVQPRLNKECIVNDVSYSDFLTEINDTTLRVERTWEVIDWTSGEQWQYVQIITVIHEALGSTVCVTTADGEPISGVELIPGVTNDNSGCHEFPDPDGIIVTPVKDSPFEDGVNILDLIILSEGLLGIHPLSFYQKYAADITNSASVSAIDLVEMYKFLGLFSGNYTPHWSHAWRFFEQTTQQGSADISDPLMPYKFIGVKMGDLDNSYLHPFDLEDIILRSEDDVLNAGETYSVPFYLEKNENLAGFAIRIKNENNNIDFLNVRAPNLPGFDSLENVIYAADAITIQWVSPSQFLLEGVAVDSTASLFILDIRANENIILNEHLSLEATFDNLLKPSGDDAPLQFRLSWEDVVVNSVVQLDNGRRIEFYPNPATEILHLKGIADDEDGKIMIMDPTGRIAFEENITSTLDISRLQTGMYYIMLFVDGKKSAGVPLVKL